MDKSMNNSNVITITTSETLRIDGDRGSLHLQGAGAGGGQPFQKKKSSSFQITSITSRLSNDGGEDSADDTEDISDIMDSSKVTDLDQETPSYEDSRSEEVFFGAPPVIPTSSQYGITALVQQTGSGGVMTAMLPQGVTVNVTEGGIALAKADGEHDDVNHWQNRFKIVKIDSNEPFKRGRWICLDFMDSPAVTAAGSVKKDDGTTVVVAGTLLKDGEAADHQPQTVVQLAVPSQQQQQPDQAQQNQQQQSQQQPPQQQQQPPQGQTSQAQSHPVPVPQQYQVPHTTQASTPMVPASQGAVPLQPTTHMAGVPTTQGQANLPYPPHSQPAPLQGQLQSQMSQGYAPGTQAPGQIHPSPSPHTPPQAQPLQPPPLQQAPPQLQPQVSQPSMVQQPAVSASGGVMVPPASLSQPPQHQPPMTSQNLPQQPPQQAPTQQGLSGQSVPQSGVMAQPLQPGVMPTLTGQSLPKPGVPHQPTPVLSQPQTTLPQKPVAQPQLSQPLPTQTLAGAQQLPPLATSQQLPVSQQVGATLVPATAAMGATQQMPTASSAAPAVKPAGLVPTPATTPAQPQTHHNMGAATGAAAGAPEQAQSSLPQPQKPPTNLEGIPLSGQPQEEGATNATPPAQQDDER